MISTIMIRTLMDERYYYGIRQEAAYVLSKVSQVKIFLRVVCHRIITLAR